MKGFFQQYGLMYVVASERDVIQRRVNCDLSDVFLYRSTATPEQARKLFLDVMRRVNKLAREPEFYDTLTNNCTTNIRNHINHLKPDEIPYDYRVLLPGYSDRLAYDLGLIERHGSYEETRLRAGELPGVSVSRRPGVLAEDPSLAGKFSPGCIWPIRQFSARLVGLQGQTYNSHPNGNALFPPERKPSLPPRTSPPQFGALTPAGWDSMSLWAMPPAYWKLVMADPAAAPDIAASSCCPCAGASLGPAAAGPLPRRVVGRHCLLSLRKLAVDNASHVGADGSAAWAGWL